MMIATMIAVTVVINRLFSIHHLSIEISKPGTALSGSRFFCPDVETESSDCFFFLFETADA